MCRNQSHNRIFGKAAVIEYVEIQMNPKDYCDARKKYVANAVESFRTWLEKQNANAEEVINRIEQIAWSKGASGRNAVVALIEAEHNPTGVHDKTIQALTEQVQSFKVWLREKGADADAVVGAIKRDTWKTLKNNVDDEFVWSRGEDYTEEGELSDRSTLATLSLSDTTAGKSDIYTRLNEQEDADFFAEYNTDQVALRGMNAPDQYPSHVEQTWVEWLSKVDAVYHNAAIIKECYLPKQLWLQCQRARTNLNNCRKSRMLDYDTYALLTNWLNRLMGSQKRLPINDTVDPADDFSDADVIQLWYSNG